MTCLDQWEASIVPEKQQQTLLRDCPRLGVDVMTSGPGEDSLHQAGDLGLETLELLKSLERRISGASYKDSSVGTQVQKVKLTQESESKLVISLRQEIEDLQTLNKTLLAKHEARQ